MNVDVKVAWLAALRSGEYAQGEGKLTWVRAGRREYCCLGVLCALAVRCGVVDEVTDGVLVRYADETNYTPTPVRSWAELDHYDPMIPLHALDDVTRSRLSPDQRTGDGVRLSWLNDARVPFDVIADLIEEYL